MDDSEPQNQSKSVEIGINQTQTKTRILSVDVFRGLTITLMVFVNSVGGFTKTPWWSRHAVDYGLTYVDLVAPFFVFAIGLTYHMSYMRNFQKDGGLNAFFQNLRRYAAFIGIGFIGGSYHFFVNGIFFGWGVLQSIGIAGIFTLLFIRFPRYWRLIIAIILTIIYQLVLFQTISIDGSEISVSDLNFNDVHGGFIGAFGYGLILLYSSIISEAIQTKRIQEFIVAGLIFTSIGLITQFFWGISKERMTVPYVLISVGIASILFYIIWYIYDYLNLTKGSSGFFQPQGKNSFFLYILHGLIIGDMWLIFTDSSPFTGIFLVALLNLAIIWRIAVFMDNRKKYIII